MFVYCKLLRIITDRFVANVLRSKTSGKWRSSKRLSGINKTINYKFKNKLSNMEVDPNNNVVKLCAQGMDMEGKGKPKEAGKLFLQAWNEATDDFEKFTAAHYVARHQKNVTDKLKWDETALQLAMQIDNDTVKEAFPSLYLNIAKCYEDLNDFDNARKNFDLALSFANLLPDNGYGNMIKGGILKGLDRLPK